MRPDSTPGHAGALWFALLGGPAAWSAHLLGSYPLVPLACRLQTTLPLNLLTVLTALIAAAASITGWASWRRLRRPAGAGGGGSEDAWGRARFMAGTGAVLAAFFVYVILVEGLPPLLQPACAEAI